MADEVAKEILGFDPDETFGQTDKSPNTGGEIQLSPEVKERFKEFVINGGAGVEIDETTRIVEDKLFVLGNSSELKLFDSEIERIYYRYDSKDKNKPFKQVATIHFIKDENNEWKLETIWFWNEEDVSVHFHIDPSVNNFELIADLRDTEESFLYNPDGSFKEYTSSDNRFSSRALKDIPRVSGKLISMPSKINMLDFGNLTDADLLENPTNPDVSLDDSWKLGTIRTLDIQFK